LWPIDEEATATLQEMFGLLLTAQDSDDDKEFKQGEATVVRLGVVAHALLIRLKRHDLLSRLVPLSAEQRFGSV
jgi:hypothetical protein